MNQKTKTIINSVIIALIIIAGIATVAVWGFNKELRFSESQRIDIYVGQEVDKEKVEGIASEVLGMHSMVKTVEIYKDMVVIRANSISEEQRNTIVNKMKENYEFEQKAEDTDIKTVPATRIRDMYKQYVLPIIIAVVLVTVYMMIRYYKKGMLKVLATTTIIPVIIELLFLSWIAISRIPVGRFTPIFVILVYIASIYYAMKKIEK